jgi:hypothetical protein
MSISGNIKTQHQRAYVPSTALAKAVEFDDSMMRVVFTDGRVLCVPIAWFPRLLAASPDQRARCDWPELDEDLSIAGLMAGVDWRSA